MPKHFIKVKQNFTCDHCGQLVKGSGYTNHCPHCLYSKHVDEEVPGDRQSPCHGLMPPLATRFQQDHFIIYHRCLKCAKTISNQAAANDNQDLLIQLSSQPLLL